MPTLADLLKTMEIDIEGDTDKQKDDPSTKVDVEKLPDEQKAFFKKLQEENENLKNEAAKKELMLKGFQEALKTMPKGQQNQQDKEEKIFGVINPDDPDADKFKAIADAFNGLKSSLPVKDPEKDFQKAIVDLYGKHKDMVRYVDTMDELFREHPTYRNNVEQCYKIAKAISEGSTSKADQKRNEITNQSNLINFRTERGGGFGGDNVQNPQSAPTIKEAFENAYKSLMSKQ